MQKNVVFLQESLLVKINCTNFVADLLRFVRKNRTKI